MAWLGRLDLQYRHRADPDSGRGRTIGHGTHSGPLRILHSLYPEGPSVCHHVLVHPPGGIVGGDELAICAALDAGCHALLTTPGASRFYRSAGPTARQTVTARLADGARLEWLPLETLVHDAARGINQLGFDLAPGAEMLGWDVLALGLPAADQPFVRGRFAQSIAVSADGRQQWLDRGLLDLDDLRHAARTQRLLASPLGWGGHGVLATLWFAAGSPIGMTRAATLLDAARDIAIGGGGTAPHPQVVVLRLLGARVEPLMRQLVAVWSAWRQLAWALPACLPRVWRT